MESGCTDDTVIESFASSDVRKLLRELFRRNKPEVTQEKLAGILKCKQSRVSTVLNEGAGDLRVQTVIDYASAMGYEMRFVAFPKPIIGDDDSKQERK